MTERPRVLFVGRARYSLPLPAWLAKKWDAVEQELDYRVIGAASADSGPSDDRFRLARPARLRRLDGLLFYLRLPLRLRNQIRSFRPQAIFASDPFLGIAALAGRALARRRVPVIVEVHGDWRTFSRLYGSPARRLISPLADALAAHDHEPGHRQSIGDQAPRNGKAFDVRVWLERPDERRRRPVWERDRRSLGERRKIAEGGEHCARRHPSRLLDEAGRKARDGPGRIGAPDRLGGERVCKRADQPARGRAVEARERSPVAVDLDDHRHPLPRKRPADKRGDPEKGIGREDCLWSKAPNLVPQS